MFRLPSRVLALLCLVALGSWLGACNKVTHEKLDEWGGTEEGPAKLLEALKSSDHNAELRAHAAQVLVEVGRQKEVVDVLKVMNSEEREPILVDLAPRLWDLARIDDPLAVPLARQSTSKDVLFALHPLASGSTRAKIDDYLVEWYTGGQYEARATSGSNLGYSVMRELGSVAAKRLLAHAKSYTEAKPKADGSRPKIGDELLKGLAATGDPQVLSFLVQLMNDPLGDTSLPTRVSAALNYAFVSPGGLEAVDGKKLLPLIDVIKEYPYRSDLSGAIRNDSIALLASVGAPECIPLFVEMIHKPDQRENFLWIGIQQGIRCAGPSGWQAIVEAVPVNRGYERGMLEKYLWMEVLKYEDKAALAKVATSLLDSGHWVSRAVGLEILRVLGQKSQVFVSIDKIRSLSADKESLRGWAGKDQGADSLPRTISELAKDVANSLEGLASEGGAK